ncbi:MAG: sugar phosphate isomerase/epimerase [Bacteroidales bacterium]|nr:sugar phosphate isomerase/epimerase [Bacteroidales bacterium]
MRNVNRRRFLKTSLVGAAFATAGQSALANKLTPMLNKGKAFNQKQSNKSEVDLKLSFQEGIAPGKTLRDKFDFMEKHDVVGFEPGGNGLLQRVPQIQEELKDRNIKVSAVCAGFDGFVLSTDRTIREQFHDSMSEIIIAAGQLGSTGVIFVPAFNHQTPVMPHTMDTRDYLCEEIDKLGNIATEHGTTVIFEPLNRKETFYLRQVADAAAICRDINNPGVRCMGDFWHMTWEETSDSAAFVSADDYLQHVHIASRKRRSMPGEDGVADNYIDGFRGLKQIGYDNYVSFECGCQGDREIVVLEALQLLRKQWSEA